MKLQPTGQFEVLEPGMYTAVVESITPEKSQFEDGSDQLKWIFRVSEPGAENTAIFAWSGQTYGPKSKTLRPWAMALLPGFDPDSDELDTDLLEGKSCRVVLITKVGNDGKERNRVNAVLSAESRRRSAAPAPARRAVAVGAPDDGRVDEDEAPPF